MRARGQSLHVLAAVGRFNGRAKILFGLAFRLRCAFGKSKKRIGVSVSVGVEGKRGESENDWLHFARDYTPQFKQLASVRGRVFLRRQSNVLKVSPAASANS
jgi:hypothetical protein